MGQTGPPSKTTQLQAELHKRHTAALYEFCKHNKESSYENWVSTVTKPQDMNQTYNTIQPEKQVAR